MKGTEDSRSLSMGILKKRYKVIHKWKKIFLHNKEKDQLTSADKNKVSFVPVNSKINCSNSEIAIIKKSERVEVDKSEDWSLGVRSAE